MTGNESITLLYLFSIISIACTIYGTFSGRRKDIAKQAEENAVIKTKLDTRAADQRSALVQIEKMAAEATNAREHIMKHEFRLDDHERRIKVLEERKDI